MNQTVHRQNAILVRQGNSHIMEHHVKCVLLEATVLMGNTNVQSVLLDTSKCNHCIIKAHCKAQFPSFWVSVLHCKTPFEFKLAKIKLNITPPPPHKQKMIDGENFTGDSTEGH